MNNSIQATQEEKLEYLAYHTSEDFFKNMNDGIRVISEMKQYNLAKNHALICGGMAAFDKGVLDFLNVWKTYVQQKGYTCVLLSEVTAEYRRYTGKRVHMPFLCPPHLLAKEIIVLGLEIPVTDEMVIHINRKMYLKFAAESMRIRHPDLGINYEIAWTYYADMYINILLHKIKPKIVYLWNQFYAFHRIIEGICLEREIQVEYMEFGCLPGTITIEQGGQQGESWVAAKHKKLKKGYISKQDFLKTKDILTYLKTSGLNRNIQNPIIFQYSMLNRYKNGQPIITYFGQNDYESGLHPYTEKTRKYHSPVFRTTLDALQFLELLSIRNEWNLIYKPHPIIVSLGLNKETKCKGKYTEILDVDINSLIEASSVVVTILSQSAYISLIREVPVVMLGYTQLRYKKCNYEAFKKEVIEKRIKQAIKKGLTMQQRKAFMFHCTQLIKHYLYDDLTKKSISIGKGLL